MAEKIPPWRDTKNRSIRDCLNRWDSLTCLIIHTLNNISHISLEFLWVPSRTGSAHNEKVDNLAKNAISNGTLFSMLPLAEIYRLIHQSSSDDWNNHYPSAFTNPKSQYFKIQPQIPAKPWYSHFSDLNRPFIVKLSRLRFGHNRLSPHLCRIDSVILPIALFTLRIPPLPP